MPSRHFVLTTLSLVFVFASVCGMWAQSPVGLPEVTPKYVQLNVDTPVMVTARIVDPGVIKTTVILQEVDNGGNVLRDLGMMHDDGANGDLKKGDGVYTIQVSLKLEDKANPRFLRVSAKFNGMKSFECGKEPVSGVNSFLPDALTPDDIKKFFTDNPTVIGSAAFLQRLNPKSGFKHDWIMMTASVSAQQGNAQHPRIIFHNSGTPGANGSGATAVFGVAQEGEGKDIIEYIQWDSKNNRFRFHEIDAKSRTITENAKKCNECHMGSQDEKKDWPYPRPNWDAYDSWGGALPFNRDRIYIGKTEPTVEHKAMQRLLKDLAKDDVVSQLDLPEGISRTCDGKITIVKDPVMDGSPAELGKDNKTAKVPVKYQVTDSGKDMVVAFPGDKSSSTDVEQGGDYLTMHHLGKGLKSDEGRGVALFDHFSVLNAARVAQELADKFTKEGLDKPVVDIRPVALAIAGGGTDGDCKVNGTNLSDYAPKDAVATLLKYFNGLTVFDALQKQTLKLRQSLPQMKAEQEALNIRDLLDARGDEITAEKIVKQVGQRSAYGPPSQGADFNTDVLTKFMIDREIYDPINLKLSLFRLFLEPAHEPVDEWTLSFYSTNSGVDHSETYTFADVFDLYTNKIKEVLNNETFGKSDGTNQKKGSEKTCADLKADSLDWFQYAMKNNPGYFDRK